MERKIAVIQSQQALAAQLKELQVTGETKGEQHKRDGTQCAGHVVLHVHMHTEDWVLCLRYCTQTSCMQVYVHLCVHTYVCILCTWAKMDVEYMFSTCLPCTVLCDRGVN